MVRPAPSLLVLTGLLTLLTTPVAAQEEPSAPIKTSTKTCGAYTLKLSENGFDDPADRVSITRGGVTSATISDTAVDVNWCRDVTGDGVPEVLLSGFSGGAHCCFTHTLYSLTTPPRKLLTYFGAHSDGLDARQLDGKGPLELVGSDWRFAYAYGLSFAESIPLPVVFSYVNGQYVDNTRSFPGFLRGFTGPASTVNDKSSGGDVLANYATLVAIGQPGEAQAYVQKLPARFRAWLTNYGPDIRQVMNDYGMTDWPVRAGVPFSAARLGLGGAFTAPGKREYLGLVAQGNAATLRLYRPQGAGIVAGPTLLSGPIRSQADGYLDTAWFPLTTVRRASGRDDALVFDERSGSARYLAYRVSAGAVTELKDDALAVTARLLGDLSNVAKQVASQYRDVRRTPAQVAEGQRRIDAAAARAQPWLKLTNADLPPARTLGNFGFDSLELSQDSAAQARAVLPVSLGFADETTDSEYIDGERYTMTINLTRGAQGWAVKDWTLAAREGELYPDGP
ncbi:hypothetical protein GO986_14050 [Deinococcus sp. HMF7620]|uniref:Lipoprotein n=1 Tax=Deinococcus arboris TaxID=2682977 RepID=A0A7C9LVD5_9DEIO|nr:hypothetical protein [Deinococcus arboris]MVN87880.1 hypothetical protein [Deinococcus arboris]